MMDVNRYRIDSYGDNYLYVFRDGKGLGDDEDLPVSIGCLGKGTFFIDLGEYEVGVAPDLIEALRVIDRNWDFFNEYLTDWWYTQEEDAYWEEREQYNG